MGACRSSGSARPGRYPLGTGWHHRVSPLAGLHRLPRDTRAVPLFGRRCGWQWVLPRRALVDPSSVQQPGEFLRASGATTAVAVRAARPLWSPTPCAATDGVPAAPEQRVDLVTAKARLYSNGYSNLPQRSRTASPSTYSPRWDAIAEQKCASSYGSTKAPSCTPRCSTVSKRCASATVVMRGPRDRGRAALQPALPRWHPAAPPVARLRQSFRWLGYSKCVTEGHGRDEVLGKQQDVQVSSAGVPLQLAPTSGLIRYIVGIE
jgi:hypothetical protein